MHMSNPFCHNQFKKAEYITHKQRICVGQLLTKEMSCGCACIVTGFLLTAMS